MRQVANGRRFLSAVAAICLVCVVGLPAGAQAPAATATSPQAELALQGHVSHPRTSHLSDLQAMPPITVEVPHTGPKGVQTNRYTGVLLWTLVQAAEPIDENGPHTHLQHTLRAVGRDGYSVALAIGEIDPNFEGKQVLVAYAKNGQPMTALRLVVPADNRAGRSVRDLVSIEVY